MLLSFGEILDILVMVFALGFIFKDFIKKKETSTSYDPLLAYQNKQSNFKKIMYAAAIIAPGIIFHEFGHKFVAMGLGAKATFFAACSIQKLTAGGFNAFFDFPCQILTFAIIAKFMNFGFIFLAPGYVAHTANLLPWQSALISAAGPLVNVIFWFVPKILIKKNILKKYTQELFLTSRINGFLAIFNFIPIPGFDGFHLLRAIFNMF